MVEAKKLTTGPQNVLTQAERYARGLRASKLDFNGCRCPFLYSTNGEILWFHDVRHELNRSRKVSGFHTPAALGGETFANDEPVNYGAHDDDWMRMSSVERRRFERRARLAFRVPTKPMTAPRPRSRLRARTRRRAESRRRRTPRTRRTRRSPSRSRASPEPEPPRAIDRARNRGTAPGIRSGEHSVRFKGSEIGRIESGAKRLMAWPVHVDCAGGGR